MKMACGGWLSEMAAAAPSPSFFPWTTRYSGVARANNVQEASQAGDTGSRTCNFYDFQYPSSAVGFIERIPKALRL
ncbi:uncharacterized protein [Aegilops tauschii subsp. strangulata]|uniref:uncharacterized protein isoform X3 n=1 Tax=Aegilops tauschii subsp. strangulata TaxID=200361 RepID=UPI00098ABC62